MTAGRLSRHLPALVAVAVVAALATGTYTFAAGDGRAVVPQQPVTSAAPSTLTVPDVRGQVYVFAKGILDDAGFAWKVTGAVQGYAVDTVASQSPAPGTRVAATGAPVVVLRLARNTAYKELGQPQDASPFAGTAARLAGAPARTAAPAAPKETSKPAAAPKPKPKPVVAAKPKPAAKPLHPGWPATRPPAFVVAGAKKEPLDEMPLPDRAALLGTWLAAHRTPTAADAGYYDYQHAWVVVGARFGWWHGAQALRTLIEVDLQAEKLWGMGPTNEQVARAALAEVTRRSR